MSYLTGLDKLPERARTAVRALLGRGLSRRERESLPDYAWSAYAYRRSMSLVAAGSPAEALTILEERQQVLREGVLRYPLALAQVNSLRWPEAQRSIDLRMDEALAQPFLSFSELEKTELRIRPRIEGAFLSWYRGQVRQANQWFAEAEVRARFDQATFLRLEARLGCLLTGDSASASGRIGASRTLWTKSPPESGSRTCSPCGGSCFLVSPRRT